MGSIEISHLSKRFGSTLVLDDLSLSINNGEFFFILGPSGCGKSTLLRCIAGLEHQDSGRISLDGAPLDGIPPHKRDIGMVFQQYALWPHMTVERNVSFGLEARSVPAADRRLRVKRALEMVRLDGLGARYPHELSGGQQQRVALARALVIEPRVILLDEPLSNLDARLRDEIRDELSTLHSSLKITMVYVTHDQEDALALASRIAIMKSGKVIQLGGADEVYKRPRSSFVAQFLGDANLIPSSSLEQTGRHTLCVRPENVSIGVDSHCSPPEMRSLAGTVTKVTFKGSHIEARIQVSPALTLVAHASASVFRDTKPGAPVFVSWSRADETILEDGTP